MKRLRFSNQLIRGVSHLISNHMFSYRTEWTDAAIRRFISRVGRGHIPDLFMLRQADLFGVCRKSVKDTRLYELHARIEALLDKNRLFDVKDLAVNGKDIMNSLSLAPGPKVGYILQYLHNCVLEDPDMNVREILLRIARNFHESRLDVS